MTASDSIEARFGAEPYAYVTTTGRRSGQPREIEIWFVALGNTIYLLNGGDGEHAPGSAGWVHNLRAAPRATVRIGVMTFEASARFPERGALEDLDARAATYAKHQPGYSSDLVGWRDTGVLVALDIAR